MSVNFTSRRLHPMFPPVLLACGVLAVACGIGIADTMDLAAARLLRGSPTDPACWLLLAGSLLGFGAFAGWLRDWRA